MSAAHTPGPWTVNSHPNHQMACIHGPYTVAGGFSANIATLKYDDDSEDEERAAANAHLIAAAPELLTALKAMIAPMEGMDADKFIPETAARLKAARLAIAKAEGAK